MQVNGRNDHQGIYKYIFERTEIENETQNKALNVTQVNSTNNDETVADMNICHQIHKD